MSEVQTFPNLPLDVARYILETAAFDRRDASRLVLVSKAVRTWIDPILYHTVVIASFANCEAFVKAIQSRNNPTFFARHVKRLCVHYDEYYLPHLRRLMEVLTGLHYLAWWCDTDYFPLYINAGFTSVRYLSTYAEIDSPLAAETLLPRNLMHLDLDFEHLDVPLEDDLTTVWKAIFTRCPFLTHVMVNFDPSSPPDWASEKERFVRSALSVAPPTLKALILEFQNFRTSHNVERLPLGWDAAEFGPSVLEDSRFIIVSPERVHSGLERVVCYPVQHDPFLDWQYSEDADSMDIWEFVDSYMLRRNEIRVSRNPVH